MRYPEFEIMGAAEIRDGNQDARAFSPQVSFKLMMNAELRRFEERPPEMQPAFNAIEAFLLALVLCRYITYCARRRRYAAMNGAARHYAEVRASVA